MDIQKELVEIAQKLRALSKTGLTYSLSEYDTERYEDVISMSDQIMALVSEHKTIEISDSFLIEKEYATPKIDIRAVVFNEQDEILLVQEKLDYGRWSLPGGWADIGYTPNEVAVKEVKEETGLEVAPVRLLAVLDKKCYPHPPALHYSYKIFILCEVIGGQFDTVFDIMDKGFFPQNNLPELSLDRVTKEQIDLMYEYRANPQKKAIVD